MNGCLREARRRASASQGRARATRCGNLRGYVRVMYSTYSIVRIPILGRFRVSTGQGMAMDRKAATILYLGRSVTVAWYVKRTAGMHEYTSRASTYRRTSHT
eukprot:3143923-Prymnesium_polylepis.2